MYNPRQDFIGNSKTSSAKTAFASRLLSLSLWKQRLLVKVKTGGGGSDACL